MSTIKNTLDALAQHNGCACGCAEEDTHEHSNAKQAAQELTLAEPESPAQHEGCG